MAESKPTILVVEDEASIRTGLCDALAYHGYAPEGAERGDEGLRLAVANRYALLLLDVMLPGKNGFEVCRLVRAACPRLPIMMLTARGSEADVLDGFRAGADDYVTKPFSVAEVMARIEALLRRTAARAPSDQTPPFTLGSWQIDPAAMLAHCDGRSVELTPKEFELVAVFAREPGRVLSRDQLLMEIWDYPDPDGIVTRTVDMHVAKLRKKLSRTGETLFETIRGRGYRFPG